MIVAPLTIFRREPCAVSAGDRFSAQKRTVYDTGRKRWCRKCRTFEIVLTLTPAGMAERELADMLTAGGRRLPRRDAPEALLAMSRAFPWWSGSEGVPSARTGARGSSIDQKIGRVHG